jgi:hypothetical protein
VYPAFFIAPAMNPRTVCFCQPIFSTISAKVAPFFRWRMATTWAVLLPSRGAVASGALAARFARSENPGVDGAAPVKTGACGLGYLSPFPHSLLGLFGESAPLALSQAHAPLNRYVVKPVDVPLIVGLKVWRF